LRDRVKSGGGKAAAFFYFLAGKNPPTPLDKDPLCKRTELFSLFYVFSFSPGEAAGSLVG
jgi:hypothetical protein